MSDSSSIVRDEQFWFTGAVVAFNAVVLDKLSGGYAVFVSATVSVLGIHIVLTRWSACAGRRPPNEPDFKTAKASERLRYSWLETKKAWASLPYIIAEVSGSLFFLVVIILTFVAVFLRFLYATKT
jgi:hypothetical protein